MRVLHKDQVGGGSVVSQEGLVGKGRGRNLGSRAWEIGRPMGL